MPDSPTSEPESDFVCECDVFSRSACRGESFYKEHEGKRYCVLHFPGEEKSSDFDAALKRKRKNNELDFHGVWFPDQVSFCWNFDFNAPADFRSATFSGEADFRYVTFSDEANFESATFGGEANFSSATFSVGANFMSATFSDEANFESATFGGEADFSFVTFRNWAIYFESATFSGQATFFSATFSGEATFKSATFSGQAFFQSATFSGEATFNSATFSAKADFNSATFSAKASFDLATFSTEANFVGATFSAQADFRSAVFSAQADFSSANFTTKAYFFSATFRAEAIFSQATFADANFTFAIFSAVAYFNEAIFGNYVEFAGNQDRQPFSKGSSLNLQFATIEKPDRVSFHTLTLHPHWFINIDPRKFDFMNIDWENSGEAKPELELLIAKEATSDETPESAAESSPTDPGKEKKDQIKRLHRLLGVTCQRLAANREENNDYRRASHFRRMALDAERLESWHGFDLRRLNWWYWAASGYGERPFQALVVLFGILLIFGLLYTKVGFARWEPRLATEADVATATKDEVGASLPFRRALSYSAGVMTLQKPEPKPATWAAQFAVLFETILGPVQAALLALAIRRKFMR